MRTLLFLLRKEFKQIFRDKILLRMIILLPVIQLIVLPLAADYEFKNIRVTLVDQDHSTLSKQLINKISHSHYFQIYAMANSYADAYKTIEQEKSDIVVVIPHQLERNLIQNQSSNIFLAINAINGSKALVGGGYLNQIIAEFNQEHPLFLKTGVPILPQIRIATTQSNWFNIWMNYKQFMVPGILVLLVTMVSVYMCSLNIVKEKEMGTIEQINVTPIKKHIFILGKLIPFWIIGIFIFTIGLFVVSRLIYGIVPLGNILLLYGYLGLYLIAVLGIGLLISTYSNTQQQAMSLAFFFVMIFLLMSGLFTSIESMPDWARWISRLNPVSYFIEVNRMIIMKGSGLNDIKIHWIAMIGFAFFFNGWAIFNYKKTA